MGADFCQQEVSVTMVTRRKGVMSLPLIGALHCGVFLGVGSDSLFFTLSSLLSHIQNITAIYSYPANEFECLGNLEFN